MCAPSHATVVAATAALLVAASPALAQRSTAPDLPVQPEVRPGAGAPDEATAFLEEADRELGQLTAEMELETRTFLDESDREYREVVGEVERLWGRFVPSTRPMWSSYSSDRRSHGEADFEHGTVTVELLVDEERPTSLAELQRLGQKLGATAQAMTSPKNPARRDPLQGLVDRGDGKGARPEEVKKVVEEKVARGEVARRKVKAKDGRERTVVAVALTMVPDRLARSARPFLPLVEQHSLKYGLDPELVLAVIHTESFFNPFARSGAPAYGLMQLVPTSGAKEAWGFVHGTPRRVEPAELYRPEVNVELGSAYLHLLLNRHFKDMQDPEARVLASISAYNCGPTNTRRALAPLGGSARTLPVSASASQVKTTLLARAPQETRQYVRLVSDRRTLWRAPTR